MLVSVIITTKNEGKNIQKCLESVKNQAFPLNELEIIVVDNKSGDETKEISRKYTNQVFDFGPERSAQRNFGVSQSKGKYILYLDADMELPNDLVSKCVEKLEKEKDLAALYIPEKISGQKYFNRVRNFERSFYNGTPIDVVRFLRKEIFIKAGGFNETLTGPEDWDFDKKVRQNGKTEITDTFLIHHEENFNLKKYIKKKAYYGNDFAKYIAKWGEDDEDIRKQFGFSYRFFRVFWENGKWKKILRHPILTIGMYFLRFLVGANYLLKR